jgi:hypothetical protein
MATGAKFHIDVRPEWTRTRPHFVRDICASVGLTAANVARPSNLSVLT